MSLVNFRQIVNQLWSHKVKVFVFSVCMIVLMGGLGYRKSSMSVSAELNQEMEEYEEALDDYEDVIAELEDSIILAQTQVDELEEYCSESVYMNLNPQKISVAEVQYGVQSGSNVGYILSALVMHTNEGSFRVKVAEVDGEISEEYLKELITCSTSGNVFHVSVMAPEQEQASRLLEAAKQQLLEQKAQIEAVQGLFTMEELDTTEYVKADSTVLNTQNTNRNNLKSYKTNLSDLKKKLIDQKANRKYYIENNKPEALEKESRVKTIFKYMIFGLVLGILLPAAWFGLRYVMANTVKGKEELLAAGIPVFGVLNKKQGYDSEIALATLNIQMLAEKKNCGQIVLNNLTDDEDTNQMVRFCTESLEKEGLSVLAGENIQNHADNLRKMVEVGNCVLVVKTGKTGYAQVEDQIQTAQKFGVSIWGCILVC